MPQIHRIFGWVFQNIVTDIRHSFRRKFWRTLTMSSQFVTEIVTDSVTIPPFVTKNYLPLWSSSFENRDGPSVIISVTNGLWWKKSVTISVTSWLWRTMSVTILPSQKIVTDDFPSQNALFRHNFINFPSQFPSQIATFSVVVVCYP